VEGDDLSCSRRDDRPRPSLHDGPPSVRYTVEQVELAARHHLEELLEPSGVTALQCSALTVPLRRERLTVTELAQSSPMTRCVICARCSRGAVPRRRDAARDRRQSSIDWYTTARKSASGRSKPTMCCVRSTPTISSTGSTQ
jgi:hypothetical protein